MILFPSKNQIFVQLSDPETGVMEIHAETGLRVDYAVGVYLAHKYNTILSYQMEGDEVVGPSPIKALNSPADVVIPDEMQKKAPKPPKADAPKPPQVSDKAPE